MHKLCINSGSLVDAEQIKKKSTEKFQIKHSENPTCKNLLLLKIRKR